MEADLSMGGQGTRDAESHVRAWLKDQGYVLEYEAAAALRSAGFHASQGRTYRDVSTGKTREVDVLAQALLTANAPDLFAVVECKRTKVPWVARKVDLFGEDLRWVPIATQAAVAEFGRRPDMLDRSLPYRSPTGPVPFDVVQAKTGEPVAFRAIAQVIDAAYGLLHNRTQFPRPALILPVVMVEAPLFELYYETSGVEQLSAVGWTRVLWGGTHDRPTLVDIVTREAFVEYARTLRWQFGELADAAKASGVDFGDPPKAFDPGLGAGS